MVGRRQFVAIALVLVLAAAAGFVWAAIRPRGQAADVRAQGQSLLDAVAREIRTKFIVRSINETEIYEGAGRGLLDAAGPACSRLIGTSPAPPAADGRQRIAALVDEATQRCTTPRTDPQRLYFGAAKGMLDSLAISIRASWIPVRSMSSNRIRRGSSSVSASSSISRISISSWCSPFPARRPAR